VEPEQPARRFIVMTDLENYSAQDNLRQVKAQSGLVDIMTSAARQLGLDRSRWHRQPQGDGELDILPPGADEPRMLGDFVTALDNQLTTYNRDRVPAAKLRLRVAMNYGIVHFGHNGFPGVSVVSTARLLDSPALRNALAAYADANLALIISDDLFHHVVQQGYPGMRPGDFREADIDAKGRKYRGWIWVPGHKGGSSGGPASTVAPLNPDSPTGTDTGPADGPQKRVAGQDYWEFHGPARVMHAADSITVHYDSPRG
jgi:hypothetical protein